MAIELNLRLNILATQNELNLRIGDNIGSTGEEPRMTGAAAPKPLSNIADAMPDASEQTMREPDEAPPPRASSSLAGLRAPESNARTAALRDLAASLQRRDAIADAAANRATVANLLPETGTTRTGESARRAAPEEIATGREAAGEDEAGEASFRDALSSVMRRAPAPLSSTGAADGFSRTSAAPEDLPTDADAAPSGSPPAQAEPSPANGGAWDAGSPAASTDLLASSDVRQASDGSLPTSPAKEEGAKTSLSPRETPSGSSSVPSTAPATEPGFPADEVAKSAMAGHGAGSLPAATSDTAVWAETVFAAALTGADGQAQPERAGVIASFILNAAMIPGWPPPRPIEGPPLQMLAGLLTASKDLSEADKELLLYLANMGLSRKHLKRLLRKLEVAKNRSKMLQGLTMFATNVASAAKALAEELADLLEDEDDEKPAMARTAAGRARLDLR